MAARVIVLGLAYAACMLLQRTAEAITLSLFVQQLGASKLPVSYLAMTLVDVPMALVYMRVAPLVNRRWLLAGLAALLVVLLATAHGLESVHPGAGLFLGYLSASTIGTFLAIHWGVLLLDAFTVDESRRAFPLVYAGGHVGGFVSGFLLRQLAGTFSSAMLMVAVPAAACLALIVLIVMLGRLREGADVREGEIPQAGSAAGARGWRSLGLLRRSWLLQVIAVATGLMVLLRLALRWLYGLSFEQSFSSPDSLTRFLGSYTMIASGIGIGLQVLATPWLLRKLGVGLLNVAYAVAVLCSFAGLAGAPGPVSAALARFTDMELKAAIKTPVSAMFYDGLDGHERAEARAIVLGVVSPLASVAGSAGLVWVASRAWWTSSVGWVAVVAAAVYAVLCVLQGRVYHGVLRDRLLSWARERAPGAEPTIEGAIEAALASGDGRVAALAREVRRQQR